MYLFVRILCCVNTPTKQKQSKQWRQVNCRCFMCVLFICFIYCVFWAFARCREFTKLKQKSLLPTFPNWQKKNDAQTFIQLFIFSAQTWKSDFSIIYGRDLFSLKTKLNASIIKKIDCINLEDKKRENLLRSNVIFMRIVMMVIFIYLSEWVFGPSLVNCWYSYSLSFSRPKNIQRSPYTDTEIEIKQ